MTPVILSPIQIVLIQVNAMQTTPINAIVLYNPSAENHSARLPVW